MNDSVEHPSHYTGEGIECIDYMSQRLAPEQLDGFLMGNVYKYMHRFQDKNGAEDLKKARWYLDRLISRWSGE